MKTFDIKADINQETYEDEFTLCIKDNGVNHYYDMNMNELLDLYEETKHAVETNIC